MNLLERFARIKTFVFDMDGVLTDGSLIIMPGNEHIRTMNIKDGFALQLAVKKGFKVAIISGGKSEAVKKRLQGLGIFDIYMGQSDKLDAYLELLSIYNLQPDEIAQHFTEVAGYFNEPFGNSSAMAAYICAKTARADGITVMLAGDGGDEIFAGNERYLKQLIFERYHQLPDALQKLLDVSFYNPLAAKLPLVKKAYSYINQAKMPMPDRLESYNFLNRFSGSDMFTTAFYAGINPNLPLQQQQQRFLQCKSDYLVDKMMYLDWKFTLADNDFVKVNQMCQLAGVEVRFPLIEKELVDFSCTVPASVKAPGQKLRDFYKNSFRGFLPDATLSKSKHGFGLPFGVWMKQRPDLQHIALNALQSFKQRNILQPAFIDQAIDTFENGHSGYYGELVWIIVVMELWLQHHGAAYA